MLTRKQLRELHGGDLPLHVLEQDYIQSLFLREIYRNDSDLVFKGGTFIKHAFGLDRFSEDLDFTLFRKIDIRSLLNRASSSLERYGSTGRIDNYREDDLKVNARLRYAGPLYGGTERSMGSIMIEISKRNDIFREPVWTRLFFRYPETGVVNVLSLSREEVLAEKLRALSMRGKGRDLYDVWFLLRSKAKTDVDLFHKKMEVMGQEPIVRIGISKVEWDRDLTTLLQNPQDLEDILIDVEGKLEEDGYKVLVSEEIG
ncbi:MAG: nucleotidyl transferase AbiEii/AbiGii toxin family protein [Thermoplasmatota archaeon]